VVKRSESQYFYLRATKSPSIEAYSDCEKEATFLSKPRFTAHPDLPPQISCSQIFIDFLTKKNLKILLWQVVDTIRVVAGVKQAC
jgi:hypothetical protein